MKLTSAALLLSFLQSSSGFQPNMRSSFVRPRGVLSSTLAPDTPDLNVADNDSPGCGALSMQIDELAAALGSKMRAQVVWDCYLLGIEPSRFHGSTINLGYDDFESIYGMLPSQRRSRRLGPQTLSKLEQLYLEQGGRVEGGVASLSFISRAGDSTTKLSLKLSDGVEIETVIVPCKGDGSTLYVSTRGGSKLYRGGSDRDLTADEILSQMFFAKKICRLEGLPDVCNIVLKDIGESAESIGAVVKAAEILTTPELFQLEASRVTVSTVGTSPEAFKLVAMAPSVLTWGVHAVNDELRRKLVPATRYSMMELREGLVQALLSRPENFRTVVLEAALIKGVNDGLEQADELVEFSRVISESVPDCNLKVNLIPFGRRGDSTYEEPSYNDVRAFQERLLSQHLFASVHTTSWESETSAHLQVSTNERNTR